MRRSGLHGLRGEESWDNELRPQERGTQVIAGDRHRLKVLRADAEVHGAISVSVRARCVSYDVVSARDGP